MIMQAVAVSDTEDKCKQCNAWLCVRQAVAVTSHDASLVWHALL